MQHTAEVIQDEENGDYFLHFDKKFYMEAFIHTTGGRFDMVYPFTNFSVCCITFFTEGIELFVEVEIKTVLEEV